MLSVSRSSGDQLRRTAGGKQQQQLSTLVLVRKDAYQALGQIPGEGNNIRGSNQIDEICRPSTVPVECCGFQVLEETQEYRIELVNRSKVGYRVAGCFRLYYVRGHNKKRSNTPLGLFHFSTQKHLPTSDLQGLMSDHLRLYTPPTTLHNHCPIFSSIVNLLSLFLPLQQKIPSNRLWASVTTGHQD